METAEIKATDLETKKKALEIIVTIENAINSGSVYIRKSDNAELKTARQVLEALIGEGVIIMQLPPMALRGQGEEQEGAKTA